ncbi:hypothetical protein L195_g025514 [Trifolium pratense]|uniref:Uncharacterized protein n=1 Tax=Trifolium pratense TaxID=57577 RepID=A0A2K3NGS4_TRIPR|nr:hypothetical protein L195_g025514 [Trifolium pratense]
MNPLQLVCTAPQLSMIQIRQEVITLYTGMQRSSCALHNHETFCMAYNPSTGTGSSFDSAKIEDLIFMLLAADKCNKLLFWRQSSSGANFVDPACREPRKLLSSTRSYVESHENSLAS